jgi:hypothetical protein
MTRRLAAVVLAVIACVAAVIRVAPLGPSLDIHVFRTAHNPQFDKYSVVAVVRGGEPIDEVSIEPLSGPVRIDGNARMPNLPAGWKVNFEVILVGGESAAGRVRVVQKGRATRTYDVDVGSTKP